MHIGWSFYTEKKEIGRKNVRRGSRKTKGPPVNKRRPGDGAPHARGPPGEDRQSFCFTHHQKSLPCGHWPTERAMVATARPRKKDQKKTEENCRRMSARSALLSARPWPPPGLRETCRRKRAQEHGDRGKKERKSSKKRPNDKNYARGQRHLFSLSLSLFFPWHYSRAVGPSRSNMRRTAARHRTHEGPWWAAMWSRKAAQPAASSGPARRGQKTR